MRKLAVIAKIQNIEAIKGKDRIEKATVENYSVIVGKGEYQQGDLCVYCFYDTILPIKPEFEFLRDRCYSALYDGFRIRNMRMAGIYSSGIIFPLSILPKNCVIKEGKEVTKILEIRKYDPEELRERQKINCTQTQYSAWQLWLLHHCKWYRQFKFGKKVKKISYPATVQKSDEPNIQAIFEKYKNSSIKNIKFYKTEKMDGQAVAYMMQGKGRKRKFYVFSHNVYQGNEKTSTGVWGRVARKLQIENLLRSLPINYCIQGEICGRGTQINIYGFDELRFFVYKITEVDTGKQLNYDELIFFCKMHHLETVPVLEIAPFPDTLEECLLDADGYSRFKNKTKKVKREGVVWRSIIDQHISFKAKSRKYSIWFEEHTKTK